MGFLADFDAMNKEPILLVLGATRMTLDILCENPDQGILFDHPCVDQRG